MPDRFHRQSSAGQDLPDAHPLEAAASDLRPRSKDHLAAAAVDQLSAYQDPPADRLAAAAADPELDPVPGLDLESVSALESAFPELLSQTQSGKQTWYSESHCLPPHHLPS